MGLNLFRKLSRVNPLSFFPRLALTNTLRTAGFLLQPSAEAPSGWLALSAVVGLPAALWAYKVCLAVNNGRVLSPIYGHSLGASIALCLLASRQDAQDAAVTAAVHGLVLENAFTSVPDMLRALYPQRWLPYRYLGPFVRDRWDARAAAAARNFPRGRRTMVLVSERDEVVPPAMGREIFDALQEGGEGVDTGRKVGRWVVLEGALHEDGWQYRDWSRAMAEYFECND
ncbi:hypothetical protein BC827DRAFT_913897 [Russula dissimulans]|nr:hypothetical protein BC827DRAFT_913897 [Russula dissimulans]